MAFMYLLSIAVVSQKQIYNSKMNKWMNVVCFNENAVLNGAILPSRRHSKISGDSFDCHRWIAVLLASQECRSGCCWASLSAQSSLQAHQRRIWPTMSIVPKSKKKILLMDTNIWILCNFTDKKYQSSFADFSTSWTFFTTLSLKPYKT